MNKAFEKIRNLTTETEATVIGLVAATIPWLAPFIPAYIAYHNMIEVLSFSSWLSLVGAAVIEFLGLSAVHTAIQFWSYNRTRRKTDEAAPVYVATAVGVFYLAVVLTVNVILDKAPVEQLIAKALLSLISVPAGITLAIRAQHSSYLLQVEAEKRERREERLGRVQMSASTEPAQIAPEPAIASYECEDCGRQFASVQALNAHGRFCSARHPERANGQAKELAE